MVSHLQNYYQTNQYFLLNEVVELLCSVAFKLSSFLRFNLILAGDVYIKGGGRCFSSSVVLRCGKVRGQK